MISTGGLRVSFVRFNLFPCLVTEALAFYLLATALLLVWYGCFRHRNVTREILAMP